MSQAIETLTMAAAMPFAAAITLNHRLPMLANAAAGVERSNQPEFQRMTWEKVQTAGQMALAFGGAIASGQQAVLGYAAAQASANAAFVGRAAFRPDQLLAFTCGSMERFNKLAESLTAIGHHSAAAALRPAHRKVTANAKRLSNRKPKHR